jgi:hypothetical protein
MADQWVRVRRMTGPRDLFFFSRICGGPGAHPSFCQMCTGGFFLEVKRKGHEAYHSSSYIRMLRTCNNTHCDLGAPPCIVHTVKSKWLICVDCSQHVRDDKYIWILVARSEVQLDSPVWHERITLMKYVVRTDQHCRYFGVCYLIIN